MAVKNSHIASTKFNAWIGRECSAVLRREYDWAFSFESAGGFSCACPWRIISDGRIAFADTDDGQLFGLPAPVDGPVRAKKLLDGRKVASVQIAPITGDLSVLFEGETALELFNNSSGYEGWNAVARSDQEEISVIALGGGALAIMKKPAR